MYNLRASTSYKIQQEKIVASNPRLKNQLLVALKKLAQDPRNPSLKSHKVMSAYHGTCWISRVNGDIRIIWNYDLSHRHVLLLLDIGGHTSGRKVYR